jgi:hypothetical protein
MKNNLFLFSLLVLFASCTQHPADNTIRPLETSSGDFNAKVTRSVPLSSVKEALIDKIYMLEYYQDRFYTLDEGEYLVLIFNPDGSLAKRINRGKGPGELLNPAGISCVRNKLIITDRREIKFYSPDGNYLVTKTLPSGCWAYCVTYLPNGNVMTYGWSPDFSKELKTDLLSNQLYHYHVIDSTLTSEILPLVPTFMEWGGMETGKSFSYYDDHYLLAEAAGNHLLVFDGEKVTGSYPIDFGKYTFTEQELKTDKYNYMKLIGEGTRFGLIDRLNETRDLISFRFAHKGADKTMARTVTVYSKKTGKTADFAEVLKVSGIPDVEVMNTHDDEFICLFQPSDFSEEQLNQFKKEGLIGAGVAMDSNPVVMFVKVKER